MVPSHPLDAQDPIPPGDHRKLQGSHPLWPLDHCRDPISPGGAPSGLHHLQLSHQLRDPHFLQNRNFLWDPYNLSAPITSGILAFGCPGQETLPPPNTSTDCNAPGFCITSGFPSPAECLPPRTPEVYITSDSPSPPTSSPSQNRPSRPPPITGIPQDPKASHPLQAARHREASIALG